MSTDGVGQLKMYAEELLRRIGEEASPCVDFGRPGNELVMDEAHEKPCVYALNNPPPCGCTSSVCCNLNF